MATFHIQTFGCQMNVRDSSWLAAALASKGFAETEMRQADAVILNTCSVREKPEQKVIHAIGRIRQAAQKKPLIVITGCVAQQLGSQLFAIAPEVRLVAGADGLAQIPDVLPQLLKNPAEKLTILDFEPEFVERELVAEKCAAGSAYVNIMQGCNNFCAYCIVPFTRGRQKSRRRQAILAECEFWLAQGVCEIALLGQNVNVWGTDSHDGGKAFAGLLRDIAGLDGLKRLRFVTPHPADLGLDVIECFADLPVLAPRLHLPLQAGADRVLATMRRRHSQKDYLELVKNLRSARPDLALSSDLIVGFPTETEAEFLETLAMLEACNFMSSYSFCYSDRPGTLASRMSGKIDPEEQQDRLLRLQAAQEKLTARYLAGRAGGRTEILLEVPSPRGGENSWQGRDPYGVCINAVVANGKPGDLKTVQITEAKKHSLVGREA